MNDPQNGYNYPYISRMVFHWFSYEKERETATNSRPHIGETEELAYWERMPTDAATCFEPIALEIEIALKPKPSP